jgi:tetratricopeptide (TPR) repeat protein
MTATTEKEKFELQIDNMRDNEQWNKILDLIEEKNLNSLFFQTLKGETLLKISKKEEGKNILEKVLHSANKEDPKEIFLIGKCHYLLGDLELSRIWHEKAAKLDEPSSQNNLGAYFV